MFEVRKLVLIVVNFHGGPYSRVNRDFAVSMVYWWPPNSKYAWRTEHPKIGEFCSVSQISRRIVQGNWDSPYKKWGWRILVSGHRAARSRTCSMHDQRMWEQYMDNIKEHMLLSEEARRHKKEMGGMGAS